MSGGAGKNYIMISKDELEKFKAIYRKKTGKNISDQDALESATRLLNLVKLVYKPMTKNELEMVENRRKETQTD